MVKDMLNLHVKHPRYGYRRITIKLCETGWFVNFKRVYRLWCQEGLKVRKKQRKKRHTGGSGNACHRKRPEYYNHIWSYDLLSERLENGRLVKLLVVIDEFTREWQSETRPAIAVLIELSRRTIEGKSRGTIWDPPCLLGAETCGFWIWRVSPSR